MSCCSDRCWQLRLTLVYRWTLDKTLARPPLGVILALIVPVSGFLVAPNLQQQFFPPAGRDQFYVEVELPAQTLVAQTKSNVLQARELVRRHPDVVDVHWFIGRSNKPLNKKTIKVSALVIQPLSN